MNKKITRATFKSFIRKNQGKLVVKSESDFNGMTDCVERVNGEFRSAQPTDTAHENTLGINGVWLVGGSRDRFSHYDDGMHLGIRVYNCCGSFIVATAS